MLSPFSEANVWIVQWVRIVAATMTGDYMKLLLISDPHIDFARGSKTKYFPQDLNELYGHVDCIAVAGDIANNSTDADSFLSYFDEFDCPKFAVPGNHDKWWALDSKNYDFGFQDRCDSFQRVAKANGFIAPADDEQYSIVDTKLGKVLLFGISYRPDLPAPEFHSTCDNDYFDVYKYAKPIEVKWGDTGPITFSLSHQVPHKSIPTSFPPDNPMFITPDIDIVLRALRSPLHLFGHSHEAVDVVHEGVRYINQPIGYRDVVLGELPMMVVDTEKPSRNTWSGERRSSRPRLMQNGEWI